MKRASVLLLLMALAAPPLFAWGEKGHYITNEAATLGLPNDMPPFFYKAFPELVWLAFDPDRLRGAGESLDGANPPDHFFDSEYAGGLELPRDRYAFIALMQKEGRFRRFGLAYSDSGFLPWRIAELSEQLASQFRRWRTTPAGSAERTFLERDIIHTAGILGHFAGDAGNPHHTTYNYNGWVDPNPSGYAIDCETHGRFENRFVSRAMETGDVVPRLAPPVLRADYFAAALQTIRASHAQVETLYRIDRDGGFDPFRPVNPMAKEFTAERIAAGASLLRDLWWSAWRNSEKPVKKKQTSED